MALSQKALALVLEFEVNGEAGYRAKYTHPIWPGEGSGVTIGIGYDLGQTTAERFRKDFAELPAAAEKKLAAVCGKKGTDARAALASVKDLVVPFEIAIAVFQEESVPRYQRQLETAMPGVERLPNDIQGALWSLVYNRGASMSNTDRRREMRQIRDAVAEDTPEAIPALLRSMIRLWVGTSIEAGMRRRREAEAKLIEEALAEIPKLPPLARTLRLGISGEDVEALQQALKDRNFLKGKIDGNFGPKTLEAVRQFQTAKGLRADGEVGAATWKALGH